MKTEDARPIGGEALDVEARAALIAGVRRLMGVKAARGGGLRGGAA